MPPPAKPHATSKRAWAKVRRREGGGEEMRHREAQRPAGGTTEQSAKTCGRRRPGRAGRRHGVRRVAAGAHSRPSELCTGRPAKQYPGPVSVYVPARRTPGHALRGAPRGSKRSASGGRGDRPCKRGGGGKEHGAGTARARHRGNGLESVLGGPRPPRPRAAHRVHRLRSRGRTSEVRRRPAGSSS